MKPILYNLFTLSSFLKGFLKILKGCWYIPFLKQQWLPLQFCKELAVNIDRNKVIL